MKPNIEAMDRDKLISNIVLRKTFLYKVFLKNPKSIGMASLLLRFPSQSHLSRMPYDRLKKWESRLCRIEES